MLLLICSTEDPPTITASPCSPLRPEWWYIHPRDAFGKVVLCAAQISWNGFPVWTRDAVAWLGESVERDTPRLEIDLKKLVVQCCRMHDLRRIFGLI